MPPSERNAIRQQSVHRIQASSHTFLSLRFPRHLLQSGAPSVSNRLVKTGTIKMRPEQGKRNSSDNLSWFQNMPHISHSSKSSSLLLSCFQRDFFFNFTIFTGSIVSGYIYNSVMTLSKVFCLRQFKILLRHRSNKNPFSKIQNFCCKLVSKEDMDLCHKTWNEFECQVHILIDLFSTWLAQTFKVSSPTKIRQVDLASKQFYTLSILSSIFLLIYFKDFS